LPGNLSGTGTRTGDDYAVSDILIHSPTCGNGIDVGHVVPGATSNAVTTLRQSLVDWL
jgi:hypothetical protein